MPRITDKYLKEVEPAKNKTVLSVRLETNLSVQIKRAKTGITRSFVFRSVLLNGKTYTEYLGSVFDLDIATARKLAEERRELLKKGVVPKDYIQEQIKKKLEQKKQNETTVKQLIEMYLSKRKNLSKNTQIHDQTIVRYLKPIWDAPISDIFQNRVCFDLINNAVKDNLLSKAKNTAAFLNQLAETAIDYNLLTENPFKRLNRLIPPSKVKHFTSVRPEYIREDLLTVFKELFKKNRFTRANLFFLAGMFTLLRPSEVASLKKANLDTKKHTFFVEQTKTLKDGFFIQTNELLEQFFIFLGSLSEGVKYFQGTPAVVAGRLNSYCKLHKLQFTSHGWRAAGMMWLVQNGVSIQVANAVLTHKIADDVTLAYMRSNLPEQRKLALYQWNKYVVELFREVSPFLALQIFGEKRSSSIEAEA
jgi:integrase